MNVSNKLKGIDKKKTAATAWDVAAAGAVCVITNYGTGNLLDLNLLSYAAFIFNDAKPAYEMSRKGSKTKCNPLILLGTGCDPDVDGESPVTIDYLKSRHYKTIGGNIFSAVGLGISPHTGGANALGGSKHAAAALTTGAHMAKLGAIGKFYETDERARGWIGRIEGMKAAKLGIRVAWTAANVIPGAGLAATIIAMAGGLGTDKPTQAMCNAVAMDLHYAAQCEKSYAGRGPALDVIKELFTKRGATRLLGKYDVDAIIDEPAGWMAVADKIHMM